MDRHHTSQTFCSFARCRSNEGFRPTRKLFFNLPPRLERTRLFNHLIYYLPEQKNIFIADWSYKKHIICKKTVRYESILQIWFYSSISFLKTIHSKHESNKKCQRSSQDKKNLWLWHKRRILFNPIFKQINVCIISNVEIFSLYWLTICREREYTSQFVVADQTSAIITLIEMKIVNEMRWALIQWMLHWVNRNTTDLPRSTWTIFSMCKEYVWNGSEMTCIVGLLWYNLSGCKLEAVWIKYVILYIFSYKWTPSSYIKVTLKNWRDFRFYSLKFE